LLAGTLPACHIIHRPAEPKAETPKAEAAKAEEPEPLPVKKVDEEIVVAAWAEPSKLPTVGGQAQILVRVQKRGGARFPGVEVRLSASGGTLYSGGKVLLTDAHGMTRDRLTAKRDARVTLNAGGTRYSFQVPLAAPKPE
jgi:hypothetical protein